MSSSVLGTAAMVDSLGRFIANVGVPATIALLILYQITPRLDRIADNQSAASGQLLLIAASCSRPAIALRPGVDDFQVQGGA